MTQITTHVLDISRGRPAGGVPVVLEHQRGDTWTTIWHAATDHDGRVRDILPFDSGASAEGIFRLRFDTSSYFRSMSQPSFYPYVEIAFEIHDPTQHYHVPLLLSPFGYSTYRGS
jgi:5-hydroxyisourate hydrolase